MRKMNMKIRCDLMHGWNEVSGGVSMEDERHRTGMAAPALDANSLTDEDYANLGEEMLLDAQEQEVGVIARVRRVRL